jgi:glycosyltransferase involved in cell wall biosynthesis
MNKTITIGIATFNRSEFLKNTVNHILDQNNDHTIEIIIVDQTQDTAITSEAENYFNNLSKKIRYIKQKKPAVCLARNTIIKYAVGDIIIFFDDDVILGSECIKSHHSVFLNNSVKSCIGPIYHRNHTFNYENLDIKNPTNGTDNLSVIDNSINLDYKGVSISCNQSFDRLTLIDLGGFDENFIGGYYEDADLGLRIRNSNHKIAFHPDAMVIHIKAPQGGLRFESKQPFSESERLIGFVLFYLRYPNEYGFRKSMWTILRVGPFRKPNIINPIKHVISWFNLIRVFFKAYSKRKQVESILK